MQIACVYSGIPAFQQKLDYIFNIFKSTLEELNVEVRVFDISKLDIGFFNGTKVPVVQTVFENIKIANGVIFATTAQRLAPNGAMQCFLEHLDYVLYGNVLENKVCLPIITSRDNSEYMAGNYINTLISSLGGISINGMIIGKEYLKNIENSMNITQMIEKYAEDFYRSIRQKRTYFVSSPFKTKEPYIENKQDDFQYNMQQQNNPNFNNSNNHYFTDNNNNNLDNREHIRSLTGAQVAELYQKEVDNNMGYDYNNNYNHQYNNNSYNQMNNTLNNNIQNNNNYNYQSISKQQKQPINYNNIYGEQSNFKSNSLNQPRTYEYDNKLYNTEEFNSVQQDDINELTRMLSQKYKEEEARNNNINNFDNNSSNFNKNNYMENITPSINTLKQKTQSLYHYFQPQLARGVNIVMQLLISGKENFNGYFVIRNGECNYVEGVNSSPDVSIISDASVWEEVIKGQSTLQKAFMLGRLKVKGNFVLVSKFEQFFKIM